MTQTVQEIQTQIKETRKSLESNETRLGELRTKRAQLVLKKLDTQKAKIDLAQIDTQVKRTQKDIDNTPAVISELQKQLAAEHQRIAEAERAKLIEQQQEIADEVALLSKNLVSLLEKANSVNTQLVAALSAEAGLREKTGQQILGEFCHGSQQSLSMLLETCQAQMSGQHTQVAGPGIVGSNRQIQL